MNFQRALWYCRHPLHILHRMGIPIDRRRLIFWKQFGQLHPDKKFVLYRYQGLPEMGVLSTWSSIAADVKWCISQNYIPIIDYKNFWLPRGDEISGESEWGDMFAQPYPYEEVLQSKHVGVLDENAQIRERYRVEPSHDAAYYKKEFEFIKKNMWFKPEVLSRMERVKQTVLPEGAKVLGVSVREEFELLKKCGWPNAVLHPEEPPIQAVIEKARSLMQEWNCEYCFLSTRYNDTVALFRSVFGEKLLYTPRARLSINEPYLEYLKKWTAAKTEEERQRVARDEDPFDQSSKKVRDEYLDEVYVLSRCNCLLATKSGASTGAIYWNAGEYEQIYFFEDHHCSKAY